MSTPMSVAARLLARLLSPAPASLVAAGAVTLAPAIVVEARASEEWQFAGWSDSVWDGAMFMGGSTPVTARDLKMYAEVLGLDEIQMDIMRDAYAELDRSYNREWTLFAEARSDQQHKFRPEGNWADMQKEMMEVKATFDQKVERLEEQFIADLRLVLTPGQLEKWAALEREQRRAKTLAKYASYSDEKVDLVACVQALELSDGERAALEPILGEYRVQIDSALAARNRKAETLGAEYTKTQQMQMDLQNEQDPTLMQEGWQEVNRRQEELVPMGLELRRLCARVRDINVQFRDRLEREIPSHQMEAFEKVARPKDANPFMFGGYSRVDQMFRMLENMDTMMSGMQMQVEAFGEANSEEMGAYLRRMQRVQPLSEAQEQQVASIKADWESRRQAIRDRYSRNTGDQSEPDFIQLPTPKGTLMLRRVVEGDDGEIMYGGFGMYGAGSDDPEMQREQSELDQKTVERLRQVLTIEQRGLFAMM